VSAQDKTGAPAGAQPRVTLDDAIVAYARVEGRFPDLDGSLGWSRIGAFLNDLKARAADVDPGEPEDAFFALEHALQSGFESIDDDTELYVVSARDLSVCLRALRDRANDSANTLREIVADVHDLDSAMNGVAAAGVSVGAIPRLRQLAAQVRAQQPAQILNLPDGMRINFQAPDGRRATLNLARLLDAVEHDPSQFEPGIADVMRAAIAAYPVAGGCDCCADIRRAEADLAWHADMERDGDHDQGAQ
jgi:hypothetical protein